MNLNLKARKQNVYDAIVVGSGITGGWAAKELCEKGLKVLMLERGHAMEHPHYPTATKDPWEIPFGGRLTTDQKRLQHIQARHWSFRQDNHHFYINDLENPYTEAERFDWIRADVVGGRSLLWSRQCQRWSDLDFEANARDGYGVDWPIRYRDIAPWYDYVERFIGVSGNYDGIAHLPDGVFQPAMELNCVEQFIKETVEARFTDRRVIAGRTANLTQPVKGRGVCQYRNLCHRGCPYGAYFSTNASTLPAAFATGNLTLKSNALVNRIIYDERLERATGVEVIDTQTNAVTEYHATVLFLNAATVATTFILLNSVSNRFPNGLGNGSDQIGRNLMDHHKCMGLSATIRGFEDKYYVGRKPTGFNIPRFRNVHEQRSDFIRGYNHSGGTGRAGWWSAAGIGVELKNAATEPGPWHVSLTGFGECLPYPDNRIVLNTNQKDRYGRNSVTINATFRDNERAMQKDMVSTAGEIFEILGCESIQLQGVMSFPGNANHEMGTARMGRDPNTSVLNAWNQMHEVPNVFVTDGSFMTSSSSVNPSLTYMAMTARACDYAVRQMNSRAI